MENFFGEMKRFVQFDEQDAEALRLFKPYAVPHFNWLVGLFYERILAHQSARAILTGPDQVERLKTSLVAWTDRLLSGSYDESYFALRTRIGRAHVRVGLPQFYMFTGMNVIREALGQIAMRELGGKPELRDRVQRALHRILDLELAMMLESYRENYIEELHSSERRASTLRLAAIGEMAASLAHEIRNPLAAINGTLEILRHDLPEESPRRPVIREAILRIRQLDERVRDLLSYAKQMRLQETDVEIAGLMHATVALMSEEPLLRGIPIEVDASESLGYHRMDRARIQEVLINLLNNAGRALQGRGLIRLEGRRLADGDLSIAVVDNGPGVPPGMVEEIFRPFVTSWPDGTGLGLSICRKIVEAHGGTLNYQPASGGGARFLVRLPVGKDRDER